MPLDFAEFVHHYEGHGLDDQQQRAHFDTFADLMECIVRLFWHDGSGAKALGITLDGVFLSASDEVDSNHSITFKFNGVASDGAAERKDS